MSDLVQKVRQKREDIWVDEPQEVRDAFLKSKGVGGSSFFPCLYGDFEIRGCHHVLYNLRHTMQNAEADFRTIKMLTQNFLMAFLLCLSWPKLHDSENFLRGISEELMTIESGEEFIEFLEELMFYIGRLNYWVDQSMPWYEIVQAYETATR